MLLLKKKKYAALDQNGKEELKGLDIVRRDWSEIARNEGRTIIKLLLHEQDEEEGVRKTHEHLEEIAAKLEKKLYRTVDLRIQKALTKAPEQYPKGEDRVELPTSLTISSERSTMVSTTSRLFTVFFLLFSTLL